MHRRFAFMRGHDAVDDEKPGHHDARLSVYPEHGSEPSTHDDANLSYIARDPVSRSEL